MTTFAALWQQQFVKIDIDIDRPDESTMVFVDGDEDKVLFLWSEDAIRILRDALDDELDKAGAARAMRDELSGPNGG